MRQRHTVWWMVAILGGIGLAGLAYVENLPLVLSLACAGGPPLAWLWVVAFSGSLAEEQRWARRYRFLLVVYTPVLILGAWELSGEVVAQQDMSEIYLRGTENYADVMLGLYPGREEYRFLKGQQLGMCSSDNQRTRESVLCRKLGQISQSRIRQEFERAIDSGVTSNGDLLRIYLNVLEDSEATPEQIDQARRMLRRHHPGLVVPVGK